MILFVLALPIIFYIGYMCGKLAKMEVIADERESIEDVSPWLQSHRDNSSNNERFWDVSDTSGNESN